MMKMPQYLFAFVLLLLSFQVAAGGDSKRLQSMQLYVTVDWEGNTLYEEDLSAMQAFRKQFPHIPMLQLLNPNYFTRPHSDYKRLSSDIKSTFLPIDAQGLHVHAWKSLTNYCGIEYQSDFSFSGSNENCEVGDCGYTVSLENAYSEAALIKLIACSNDILVKHGFNRSVHFRAGGWQMGPKLIAALEANGFVWDSSVIDADLLLTKWHEQSGIVTMLRELHPNATPLDQPYQLTEQIMEYPNNAALADYTSSKQIVTLFKALLKANKKVMVLGFHEETAASYLGHLAKAIPEMEAIAKDNGVKIEWRAQ